MRIHLVTVGTPKLAYAQIGWQEYLNRLKRLHIIRETHLADKFAYSVSKIQQTVGKTFVVALIIDGPQLTSQGLADFLRKQELDAREVSFVIGGPEGLPHEIIEKADATLSFSKLTFPHDLAMVILVEVLYRASTINAGLPYHK